MSFLTSIDWPTVFITIAVIFVLYNATQIIRYLLIRRKAEADLKRIDERIAATRKELAETKKAIMESVEKLTK